MSESVFQFNQNIVSSVLQTKAAISEKWADTQLTYIGVIITLFGFCFVFLYYLFTTESEKLEKKMDQKFDDLAVKLMNEIRVNGNCHIAQVDFD